MDDGAPQATDEDRALFRALVLEPKQAGFRALQEVHAEAFARLKADQKSWRAAQQAKRQSSLDLTLALTRAVYRGDSLEEIASALTKTIPAVRRALQSRGVYFEHRSKANRVSAWVGDTRAKALDGLADDIGCDRATVAEYILNRALEDDAVVAKRMLRDLVGGAK